MDRQGFSKVRRAELVARLTALDKQIAEQAGRAKFMRVIRACGGRAEVMY